METLLYVAFALSVLAVALCCVSLVLVFAWRKTSPETAGLRREVTNLALAQADISDKLVLWMKRDDARQARAGKRKKDHDEVDDYQPPPQPPPAVLTKEQLRQRFGVKVT